MSSLKDKVVLITGASSGIGAGTAVHLASLGCKLAINGRKLDALQKVADDCKKNGLSDDQVFLVPGDVTDDDVTRQMVEKTVHHYGQLDVLVNNAGIVVNGSVENTTMEQFDHQMNINCRAAFHVLHLCIPHIKKTKGSVVNVSSVTGIRSFPNVAVYCMSKGAIDQMTRCAALELAKDGVRVNAVNPGVIVTDIHKRGGMSEEQYAKFLEHCKDTHAMGRPGTTEEVAKAIAFLASDESSFITGATLPIDGGRHAMCPR